MNPFRFLYSEIIYRPLLNGLVLIYTVLPYHDLGIAIVILTISVRIILHPLIVRSIRSQQALARLQPRIRDIQERFKGDSEAQTRETTALYRESGVHPLAGCLPVLVQIPVLFGLFQVFGSGINLADRTLLYSSLPAIAGFNVVAFGIFDLTARSTTLAVAAGISQFLQTKLLPQPPVGGKAEFAKALQWQTTYFLPVFIAIAARSLPGAVALYWTAMNLFAIVQQMWIQRRITYEHSSRTPHPNTGKNGHPR